MYNRLSSNLLVTKSYYITFETNILQKKVWTSSKPFLLIKPIKPIGYYSKDE